MDTLFRAAPSLRLTRANTNFLINVRTLSVNEQARSSKRRRITPGTSQDVYQYRHAHTRRHVSSAAADLHHEIQSTESSAGMPRPSPLSCLPLSTLIRSYVITSVSSYPILLRPSMAALSFLAHSKSPIFNPDHNPLLRFLLKKSFYAQFCAGERPAEVRRTIDSLHNMGYKGVILGYAKEVVLEDNEVSTLDNATDSAEQEKCDAAEVAAWEKGTLATVELCNQDDFVALKFTGAGRQALQHLSKTIACAPQLEEAVHKICRLARQRGVRLLFDAEQASLQDGIDNWTMYFMRQYNKGEKALVYGTYQAYAKRTPKVLAAHLEMARRENFVLGIKLVRGAYMGSDPRELFWATIEDTHKCYDGITEAVLRRSYNQILRPAEGGSSRFPRVDFVMASHNAKSVEHARKIRDEQAKAGTERIEFAYGQLMGMADNVSTKLVQVAKERSELTGKHGLDIPRAYKYLVWGSVAECSKYLLRRAQENRDAVSRTVDARQALGQEVARRMGFVR